LIVVDTQNCVCSGGSLPLADGDAVVPVRALCHAGLAPPNYVSFKSRGRPWPQHCIQGTEDSILRPDLELPPGTEIISKAMDPDREAYSSFDETDLAQRLSKRGVRRVFVGGLATDYCVKNTVLDAIKEGFQAVLLRDAVRGAEVIPGDSERAIKEMERKGTALAVLNQIESSKE